MKRRLFLGVTFLAFFCISVFSLIAYARENTKPFPYGDTGITLNCYIKCTNSYGEGSTAGAGMDGYRNYVKVVTYDINQNSLGYKELYSITSDVIRVSNGSPYLTRTYHAAAKSRDNVWDTSDQLLPVYQQIKQAQCRDD